MQMICILLGVPEADRHELFDAVEPGFDFRAGNGTEREPVDVRHARVRTTRSSPRSEPRPADDMLSVVVHAPLDDVDPPGLTDDELYMFFSLLFAAGSETTRNAIAGGLRALVDHPDQLARAARPTPRCCPPRSRRSCGGPRRRRRSAAPRRVTTELGGHTIAPGDKVVVWEGSANRDEACFERGHDVRRRPRPQPPPRLRPRPALLPRRQPRPARDARSCTTSCSRGSASIEPAGPIEWTRSNRHTGIRHLPVVLAR